MSNRTKNNIGIAVTAMIIILIVVLKFYLGNTIYDWVKSII